MVEDDRYCVDILIQLAAVKAAVSRVGASLLENHVRGCVAAALREGDGQKAIDEVLQVLDQFGR